MDICITVFGDLWSTYTVVSPQKQFPLVPFTSPDECDWFWTDLLNLLQITGPQNFVLPHVFNLVFSIRMD